MVTSGSASAKDLVLVPLGTGKGATSVYDGDPSSAFVIMVDGKCRLLVDAGLGVVRQCLKYCGAVPDKIYISHNHTDHAGDLPVLLIVERTAGRKLTVISAPDVESRLRNYRIAELYSTGKTADEIATWVAAPEGHKTPIDDMFSVVTHLGRHSETSYGFVLYRDDRPVLGFSADSGYDEVFYRKLSIAPTLILDGRTTSSKEHASFDEVLSVQREFAGTRIFVTGYGTAGEAPHAGLGALRVGKPLLLHAPK